MQGQGRNLDVVRNLRIGIADIVLLDIALKQAVELFDQKPLVIGQLTDKDS